MKATKTGIVFFCLLLVFGLLINPWAAHSGDLKTVGVKFDNCESVIASKDSICLVPTLNLFNPNDQLVTATIGYTLRKGGQILGSAQMPTVYIPPGKTVDQKDIIVMVYRSWFARLYFEGKSPGEALKTLLPLWKGMGGKEPPKVPDGMWAKITPSSNKIQVEGSVTMETEDGTEKVFFFNDTVK